MSILDKSKIQDGFSSIGTYVGYKDVCWFDFVLYEIRQISFFGRIPPPLTA